jgi:hypothetical protein
LLRWGLAIIAGGGAAAAAQGATAVVRAHSSLLTGGLANPLVALLEGFGALALAGIAILLPSLVFVVLMGLGWGAWRLARTRRSSDSHPRGAE